VSTPREPEATAEVAPPGPLATRVPGIDPPKAPPTAPAGNSDGQAAASSPRDDEPAFQRHLRRARELIGARRLPEGELELLEGLALLPADLRALKLLAVVRFKLGRLAEAREAYRIAREVAPEDPAVRLNLGLIALKLDWYEEAVAELEAATALDAGNPRAWSYLGYAHARAGATGRAALAFRRAGQPEVAAELEQGRDDTGDSLSALVDAAPATRLAPDDTPEAGDMATAVGFAYSHLVSAETVADPAAADDVLRLQVDGESHARQTALLAAAGDLRAAPARRRRQGRLTASTLGAPGDGFVRYQGSGELWLTSPAGGRRLVPLTLVDDVLYLRDERVVAFDGEVVWEAGRVPGGGPGLLQFRGSGRVVIEAGPAEVVTLRVPDGGVISVAPGRLLGWMGRVVAQGVRQGGVCARLACEGEGVLLLSRHGDSA
jgi:tetratricopeptide (TPR) repeat protein